MLSREDKSNKPDKTRARHYPHKAWYNQDCEMKRREYIKFKNRYRQLKNVNNLDLLRQAGKVYKKEINKAFIKYKKTIVHKVRQLKTTNAREYWSIINGEKSNKILSNISLVALQEHYKKLNEGPSDQTDTTPFNQDNTDSLFIDLFTTDEVSKMIRK